MEFVLLVAISIIPVIISISLLFHSRSKLTKALSLFLLSLCFWQIDIAILYANDYYSQEFIDRTFRLFRIGSIMLMPLSYYFVYYLVQVHQEFHHYRKIFNKVGLNLSLAFSLLVYIVNFTSYGVETYTTHPETSFAPSHFVPVYGSLHSLFLINILIVFIHTIYLLRITVKVKEAYFRGFYTKLAFGSLFVFLNGVFSGFGLYPLYFSSFNSILVAVLLFLSFFQLQSERLNSVNLALGQQSTLLEEMMNINPNYLVVRDMDDKIVKVNHSICQLLAVTREELIGMDFTSFLKRFPLCGGNDELLKLTREDGEVHYIHWGIMTFEHQHEEHYTLCYGIDYTNQKLNEQLLITSEKSKVIGELAASIAHEIRNPLTTVRGFLQLMKERKKESDFEGIMLGEIDRIDEVLKELLLLAKPEAKSEEVPTEQELSLDVFQEIMNVKILFEGIAMEQNKQIVVINSLPAETLISFYRSHFKQVIINTVKNSMEALPERGTIKIKLDLWKDCVRIRIIDNGKGISKKRLSRIGEPYFTNKEKGTGIGLTICFKLVKDYEGEMSVKSKVGWGTTVTLLLQKKEMLEIIAK
ncbi:ATP-binding protein [Bacillus sp. KH172YL63]|uniref:ATP-binding protein n=1 Tax=Bacillus sp. KH172YL63 TaxID=2709784 RepID=UPI0013E5193B|nr:ATP-binding protein [Bacillus sp. KH172YL63]BCB03920.1 hypothetical protein KH172YL63_20530 [Bacillus sp. KH172YL63]